MTSQGPITTLVVSFRRPPGRAGTTTPRLQRVVKTLALAHRIEAMLATGELKDYAEVARVLGLTRARMAQITSLNLLAPAIQEQILELPTATSVEPVTERRLRVEDRGPGAPRELPVVSLTRLMVRFDSYGHAPELARLGRPADSDEYELCQPSSYSAR